MTGKGLRQNTIKMPSKYADMSPREIEYGGGNAKKIIGWILIGVGIAAMIGGIVCFMYSAYNYGKYVGATKHYIEFPDDCFSLTDARYYYEKSLPLRKPGTISLLAGAVCVTSGCILKNFSDRSCVVSDFGPHARMEYYVLNSEAHPL